MIVSFVTGLIRIVVGKLISMVSSGPPLPLLLSECQADTHNTQTAIVSATEAKNYGDFGGS